MHLRPFVITHRYRDITGDDALETGATRPLGRDVLTRLGAYLGPLDRNAIIDLVIRYGGTAGLADRLGFPRGSSEFGAAQRAIERHVSGVTPRKGIWYDRYQRLRQPNVKEGVFTIIVCGLFRISEDARERCVRASMLTQRVLYPFDPLGEWAVNMPFPSESVDRLDTVTVEYRP